VKATNNAGLESAAIVSNGQQYVPITVGIDELTLKTVYPNPTTGIVNLPQIENLKWQLIDATGRLVGEGFGEVTIDLRALDLSSNIYNLRLLFSDHVASMKIIYQKE
jgi:hypothetical protein